MNKNWSWLRISYICRGLHVVVFIQNSRKCVKYTWYEQTRVATLVIQWLYNGLIRQDAFECYQFPIDITSNRYIPGSLSPTILQRSVGILNTISYFLSFWNNHFVCNIWGQKSPAFGSTRDLYITLTDIASMSELVMPEQVKQVKMSCSRR